MDEQRRHWHQIDSCGRQQREICVVWQGSKQKPAVKLTRDVWSCSLSLVTECNIDPADACTTETTGKCFVVDGTGRMGATAGPGTLAGLASTRRLGRHGGRRGRTHHLGHERRDRYPVLCDQPHAGPKRSLSLNDVYAIYAGRDGGGFEFHARVSSSIAIRWPGDAATRLLSLIFGEVRI